MFRFVCVCAFLVAVFAANCGQECKVDANCDQGDCKQCMFGKCGAGCSFACTNDKQCLDPNCPYCPSFIGACGHSPMNKCGGTCKVNVDCDQRPGNLCKLCENGKCTAGCGQQCSSDSQCMGTCKKCVSGICEHDTGKCGDQCVVNDDCNQSGICSLCMTGKCGAGCGYKCTENAQCLDLNCPKCNTSSLCARTGAGDKCGQKCLVNSDCNGSGEKRCVHCIYGKCGAACGNYCKAASDCVTPGCQTCSDNMCAYPPPPPAN